MLITTHCPNPECRAEYRVNSETLGRRATCRRCGQSFALAAVDPIPAATDSAAKQPGFTSPAQYVQSEEASVVTAGAVDTPARPVANAIAAYREGVRSGLFGTAMAVLTTLLWVPRISAAAFSVEHHAREISLRYAGINRNAYDNAYESTQWIGDAVVGVVAMSAFFTWLYHANRSLRALGQGNLRFTPGWAVGGWFIPVLNLVRPFQILNELFVTVCDNANSDVPPQRRSLLAVAWWTSWLGTGVVALACGVLMGLSAKSSDAVLSNFCWMLVWLISIVPMLLTLILMWAIEGRRISILTRSVGPIAQRQDH